MIHKNFQIALLASNPVTHYTRVFVVDLNVKWSNQCLSHLLYHIHDVIYFYSAATGVVKVLDAAVYSSLHYIMCYPLCAPCDLHSSIDWLSLTIQRKQYCMLFIYKALLQTFLLSFVSYEVMKTLKNFF